MEYHHPHEYASYVNFAVVMQSDSFDTPPDETLPGTVVSEDYTGGLTKKGGSLYNTIGRQKETSNSSQSVVLYIT